MVLELTDKNFEAEVIKSDKLTLVDFWAPWCGPCKVLGPIVEELAGEIKNLPVKVAKLNVDDNSASASSYGVMSIPTTIFFKGGQPVDQLVGVQTKEDLKKKINELLV